MKPFKLARNILVSGVLVISIIALLATYAFSVNNLSSNIYTETQREFLARNSLRSVEQIAPTLNYVHPAGDMLPAILPLRSSRVYATLEARYEAQEKVNVTVYTLDFRGEYQLAHSGTMSTTLDLFFPFPSNLETLHDVQFLVNGEDPGDARYSTQGIHWRTQMQPNDEHEVTIRYRANGANSFSYGLMHNQRGDVDVTINVVGLNGSTVTKESLPTTTSEQTEEGETWVWHYDDLIADRNIRLDLPTRLGFAQRVAQLQHDFRTLAGLAPFLIAVFLGLFGGMLHLDGMRLKLEGYLLIGLGLALFYPLMTFLSGIVPLSVSATLSLLLVSGLLVAFVSRAIDWKYAIWRIGLLLIVFLGLFSLGMLSPWRGILFTVGGLTLVSTFMLLYAQRAVSRAPEPTPITIPEPVLGVNVNEVSESIAPDGQLSHTEKPHCPYCARTLEEDFTFCPGCGHDTSDLHRCDHCGHQQLGTSELNAVYCVRCGEKI